MEGHKGYYCLIQYCPDFSRLEMANVGVVLFCPELRFLKAKLTHRDDRLRRVFRGHDIDLRRIESAKKATAERLNGCQDDFQTLQDLNEFVASRGNDIVLTAPRPVKVNEPQAELTRLFAELVGERTPTST